MAYLEEIIIEKIRNEGCLSFHDFMDMCLYYPGYGYYVSAGVKIGMNGDFYTSPLFTPLYGELIGKQIEEMWQIMNEPSFTIVEYGGGTGHLCSDILRYLVKNASLYAGLQYCIIEKSDPLKELQQQRLGLDKKVSWYPHITALKGFTGCVLSNEVVDNFPVHIVVQKEELMEVMVSSDGKGFSEQLQPASPELKSYLEAAGICLSLNYRTEINLDADRWINDIAKAMDRGYLLIVDYGYTSKEYYHAARNQGTLQCFYRHNVHDCPYINIGRQDITAHVDFSGLKHAGTKYHMDFSGFADQFSFLKGLGIVGEIRKMEDRIKCIPEDQRAGMIKRMQHFLFDMCRKLKVLLMEKKLNLIPVSGFQFAQQGAL
jgi:SAM-dependent MidA family methyltransferase